MLGYFPRYLPPNRFFYIVLVSFYFSPCFLFFSTSSLFILFFSLFRIVLLSLDGSQLDLQPWCFLLYLLRLLLLLLYKSSLSSPVIVPNLNRYSALCAFDSASPILAIKTKSERQTDWLTDRRVNREAAQNM